MAKDFYDAADEHDIRELQRMARTGTPPKLVGGTKPRRGTGCPLVLALLVGVPAAAVVAAVKGWG